MTEVQSQVESYQRLKNWYWIPPCLTLSIIRYISRLKWSNPEKGIAPSPVPLCSSIRKGSLWVALNYRLQLYFYLLLPYFILKIQCVYIHTLPAIGLLGRVFANGPGDWGSITGWVISKLKKWYLISPCLTLSIIRYISSVKWSNQRKGVAPFPTPWCCSYWKGNLQVTLDYSCQL